MKSWLKTGIVIGTVSYYAACAPVKFGADNSAPSGPTLNCTGSSCYQEHNDQITITKEPIDVLFIVDDSGSVSDVQANIAARFDSFLNQLGQLDYRIGITTTDISSNVSDTRNNPPAVTNRYGALQDGKLIQVAASGDFFITPQTPNPATAFANTIQLPETLTCANNSYDESQCPSGDPRAIFAANLLIDSNPHGFLRPNIPLTIVIVSDSDERNSLDLATQGYPQGHNDLPATLLSNLSAKFPGKSLVVDAIVTKPGDTACYNERLGRGGNPYLFAWYAKIYSELVTKTNGVLGSVCEDNYTAQLGQIGAGVSQQAQTITLACQPQGNTYNVTFNPQPTPTINTSVDWTTKNLSFSTQPPPGTVVTVSYRCPL
jgi:hypothetical protein